MRIGILFICAFFLLVAGCPSNPHFMTPRVLSALEASSFTTKPNEFKAYTYWSTNYGHGLCIEVLEKLSSDKYSPNLEYEIDRTCELLNAVAKSQLVSNHDFVEVKYHVSYGPFGMDNTRAFGVVDALVTQSTFSRLRNEVSSESLVPTMWSYFVGYKDQPHSDKPLTYNLDNLIER